MKTAENMMLVGLTFWGSWNQSLITNNKKVQTNTEWFIGCWRQGTQLHKTNFGEPSFQMCLAWKVRSCRGHILYHMPGISDIGRHSKKLNRIYLYKQQFGYSPFVLCFEVFLFEKNVHRLLADYLTPLKLDEQKWINISLDSAMGHPKPDEEHNGTLTIVDRATEMAQ